MILLSLAGVPAVVLPQPVLQNASPDAAVLLLEAGLTDFGDDSVLALSNWANLLGGSKDREYHIEPQAFGNDYMIQNRHIGLGGCSSHNSCIWFETPDSDLADWRDRGAVGWTPEFVGGLFDSINGKVMVESADSGNALFDAMIAASVESGFAPIQFNGREYRRTFTGGVGYFGINKHGDLRQSSSVAYLHGDRKPANLDIVTNCAVTRIVLSGGRAAAIETSAGLITVGTELVVSAGAFESPKLLMLSGIGPAAHLREVGIEVAIDLPGVGSHLLDHPEGVVQFESAQPVPLETSQGWEVGIFKTLGTAGSATGSPDLMFHGGNDGFFMQTERHGYPTPANAFCFTPNVTKAASEGSVRLRSANPADIVRVDHNYFSEQVDRDVMVAGVRIAREIARQPALAEWVSREIAPGPAATSDTEIFEYLMNTHNTVYHPAGSCKMGAESDELAVVTPELKVKGVAGLRVADASVFPSMTCVNPNATCFMVGEAVAAFIDG